MDPSFFPRGVLIGLSIAAPVGPIGVLCIRRTLTDGRLAGLLSGLGAATADAFYGSVAGFGLSFMSRLLLGQQVLIRLVGGLFLLYLGLRTLRAPVAREETGVVASDRLASYYLSTVGLTLTNPMTILAFAAIFAGLGLAASGESGLGSAALLVSGVFTGSALWWLLLSGSVGLLRGRLSPRVMVWINRLSGTVIGGFGVVALLSLRV